MEAQERSILKIYASSTDRIGTELLYEYLVRLAKDKGIEGATVYRGIMGYGLSSQQISTSRFWELTEKLPVVIEMVDSSIRLNEFYQVIENVLLNSSKGCLVTIQPISTLLHKSGK